MLVYVRHGETVLNSPDRDKERLRGHLQVPLSRQGIKDAEMAGENLSRHLSMMPNSFQSSTLVRTIETSGIIGRRLGGIQATPNPAFTDWDTGAFAGQLVKDVLPQIQQLIKTPDVAPPNGEPIRHYLNRFVPAVKQLVNAPGVHLVIGHARGSSIIQGLASPAGGVGGDVDRAYLTVKPDLKPGGIMIVPPDWQIKIINNGEPPSAT